MKLTKTAKTIAYLGALLFLSYLLFNEYTYVHPYNTGYRVYPGWKYSSTYTITWWFILICSLLLTIPLIWKEKIALLGLSLVIVTLVRPLIQYKFPEEQAMEFYRKREKKLNQLVSRLDQSKNKTIHSKELHDLDFEQLTIHEGTYFFLLYVEEWPEGLCYDADGKLPKRNFGSPLKYKKLKEHWYEFDSF